MSTERWEPGDVVLAADGALWQRAQPPDPPWRLAAALDYYSEDVPERPLTLLVRNGRPIRDRQCTRCGDGDLYPRRCSQCGQRWIDWACGQTHALIAGELGVAPVVSEHTSVRAVLGPIRELLLSEGGQFDDDHTHDAHRLAKVAELLGLHVVWEACDGCHGHLIPAEIKAGSDG